MSSSREPEHRYKAMLEQSSSEESLPAEWASVQKRLDHLETAIARLTKRSLKLERRLQEQSEDVQAARKDTRALVEEVLQEQAKQLGAREKELELENMRAELDDLHAFIKRVEKKSNEVLKEVRTTPALALADARTDDRLEERVERMMQKHQADTARAVAELRRVVAAASKEQNYEQQEFAREPAPIERKSSEKALSNSRSKAVLQQRSGQKSNRPSHTEIACQEPSIDHHLKSKSPLPHSLPHSHPHPHPQPQVQVQVQAQASSRVSYLREKLKEFEETNKRFEEKLEQRAGEGTPQGRTVQKMKDFRNYLEQSESELDQSNAEQHNVLTDSIKNWRNGERYRYD